MSREEVMPPLKKCFGVRVPREFYIEIIIPDGAPETRRWGISMFMTQTVCIPGKGKHPEKHVKNRELLIECARSMAIYLTEARESLFEFADELRKQELAKRKKAYKRRKGGKPGKSR